MLNDLSPAPTAKSHVLTPDQMQLFESIAMDKLGLPGLVLMETAGHQLAKTIAAHHPDYRRCIIFCGPGNNGGDGYVAGRYLLNWGWSTECWSSVHCDVLRGDALRQYQAYAASGGTVRFSDGWSPDEIATIDPGTVLVDGLLGTGLKGSVRGRIGDIIDALNKLDNPVVAIDLPSGVCGLTGAILGQAVRAEHTVSFHASKRGHWLYPGAEYRGSLSVADIGLSSELHQFDESTLLHLAGPELLQELFSPRRADTHKGTYGHVMVIGGVNGRAGAPQLTSDAALAAGAGLVTLGTSKNVVSYLARDAYEVMVAPLYETELDGSWWNGLNRYSSAVIGPGLSPDAGVGRRLFSAVKHITIPVVLDADGLNHLAQQSEDVFLGDSWVLTPHPGEAARLLNIPIAAVQKDRVACVQALQEITGSVIVLKGANTLVAGREGRISVCPVGNPGLATAGAGDVLAGMIGSLLAQGYSASRAALLGTLWHGVSGDQLWKKFGQKTLRARDIIEQLRDVEACYQN